MIIEKATELGIALSNSAEFKRMQAAKAAMDADEHVSKLMNDYTEKQSAMVTMLEEASPDGMTVSGLSREIEEIQSTLMNDPVFSEMLEAQHQFANLMNEVNGVIGAHIGMEDEPAEGSGGCGGNCAGCSGCVH